MIYDLFSGIHTLRIRVPVLKIIIHWDTPIIKFFKLWNFSFDGQNFQSMKSSKYDHIRTTSLANYKNQVLTVSCDESYTSDSCGWSTELFDFETQKWSDGPQYLKGKIYYYSTSHTSDAAYIIGGRMYYASDDEQNIVTEFKEGQWRRLKDLNNPRYKHNSITIGGKTMVIGGDCYGSKCGE